MKRMGAGRRRYALAGSYPLIFNLRQSRLFTDGGFSCMMEGNGNREG